MSGATLDAGALIAFERAKRTMVALVVRANRAGARLAVPAGALAQAWRDGRTQARLAKLIKSEIIELVNLDGPTARAAGQLCGNTGTNDVVDASVVLCARMRRHPVVTSDRSDLARLEPSLELVEV